MDDSLLLIMYVAAMIFAFTGVARVHLYERQRSEWRLASKVVCTKKLDHVNRQIKRARIMLAASVVTIIAMVVTLNFTEHPLGLPAFLGLVVFALVGRAKLREHEPPSSPREVIFESSRG